MIDSSQLISVIIMKIPVKVSRYKTCPCYYRSPVACSLSENSAATRREAELDELCIMTLHVCDEIFTRDYI